MRFIEAIKGQGGRMTTSIASGSSAFGAGDSALGYLYQIRVALLTALRRIDTSSDDGFSVYLETLDDVVFESIGTPLELFQLKHHTNSLANLTDASPDIWKSLRIWIEGRASGAIASGDRLILMTTHGVASGSIASRLLAASRDEAGALSAMRITAQTSTNSTNIPAYTLFLAMPEKEQAALVSSIVIAPGASNIEQVGHDIRHEIRFTVRRDHVESFLSRLEGWWLTASLRHLIAGSKFPIRSVDLQAQMDDIREQLVSALPVDNDILDHVVDMTAYENEIFVHQAKLVGINDRRVLAAVRDYYRAFEQRSRWVRESLVMVGDLDKYEQKLCEEWDLIFQRALDDIGRELAEVEQEQMAKRIYEWVETSCFPIHKNVDNPSISRGSLHMLANDLRVGWHPHFMSKLQHLLESRTQAA
ncbi:ABC-three component system protein [Dyella sp. OK004]|uniref:ABC-three component system protein n=1 Tax=Dyella sp. OK004 TaxID=1855292 RepID=UPI00210164FE|nr:ABC-three component system protein [Dyella sp. OK004]